jgi:hypothetical protein
MQCTIGHILADLYCVRVVTCHCSMLASGENCRSVTRCKILKFSTQCEFSHFLLFLSGLVVFAMYGDICVLSPTVCVLPPYCRGPKRHRRGAVRQSDSSADDGIMLGTRVYVPKMELCYCNDCSRSRAHACMGAPMSLRAQSVVDHRRGE